LNDLKNWPIDLRTLNSLVNKGIETVLPLMP
jgi:hypothetical protein